MPTGKLTLTFRPESDPFKGQPPDADRFYAAVGRFLMAWGRLEATLDLMLGHIASLPEWEAPKSATVERVPASLKRKSEMWRHAFKTMPSLQPQQARAAKFMKDLMEANQDRAVIVHGSWIGFTNTDPLTVHIVSRKRKGRFLFKEEREVSLAHVERMIAEALRLSDHLSVLLLFAASRKRRPPAADRP